MTHSSGVRQELIDALHVFFSPFRLAHAWRVMLFRSCIIPVMSLYPSFVLLSSCDLSLSIDEKLTVHPTDIDADTGARSYIGDDIWDVDYVASTGWIDGTRVGGT
jgi:hypothetical protein